MIKHVFLILSFILYSQISINGAEFENDPNYAPYTGLNRGHVLLALWVNASGTGSASSIEEPMNYIASIPLPCPTIEQATEHLSDLHSPHVYRVGPNFFKGRDISGYFTKDDVYCCENYNKMHGPLRAQKVIAALRALPDKSQGTISKLYISVIDAVSERDSAQMRSLMAANKMDEAFKVRSFLSVRQDADAIGLGLAMATTRPDVEAMEKWAVELFKIHASKIAPHLAKSAKPTSSSSAKAAASTPPISGVATAASPSPTYATEFEKNLAKGLQKMWG